jgi:hypothetical protein
VQHHHAISFCVPCCPLVQEFRRRLPSVPQNAVDITILTHCTL